MILSFPVSHVSLNASSQPMLGQEKVKASPGDTQTCESPLSTKYRSSLFEVRLLQGKAGCCFSPHFYLFLFVLFALFRNIFGKSQCSWQQRERWSPSINSFSGFLLPIQVSYTCCEVSSMVLTFLQSLHNPLLPAVPMKHHEATRNPDSSYKKSACRTRQISHLGKKCLVKCTLDGVAVDALWDTGAQRTIINETWRAKHLPHTALRPLKDLSNTGKINLVAANGTPSALLDG